MGTVSQIPTPSRHHISMGDLLDFRSWLVTEFVRLGMPLDRARRVVAGLRPVLLEKERGEIAERLQRT